MTHYNEIRNRLTPAAHLQEGLLRLQRAISPRARKRTWVEGIVRVVADLTELNRQTEVAFVAIGSNLMAFLTSSRQLHSGLTGLAGLVSGEEVKQVCDALFSLRDSLQQTELRSRQGSRDLQAIQHSAGRIHRRFATLSQIALSFRVTAILARIETARLTSFQQDLGSLANEVSSCSDGIQLRAEQVVEAAVAFDVRISSILSEVSRLESIQQKELPAVLAEVDADLEQFERQRRNAAASSTQLAANLNAVANDLGDIAMAIQFHDITRQQVEHVIDALSELPRITPRGAILPAGALRVQVQQAQLKSAANSFAESARKIDLDLAAIGVRVAEMAQASKAILGLDHQAGTSFLGEMSSRLSAILHSISESEALERTTQGVVADLERLSDRLRTSIGEVQLIELQLRRISLNTAIAACHTGASGEPLNVVADAMRLLQVECAARSLEAEAELDLIGQTILSLGPSTGVPADARWSPQDQLHARLDELGAASESSRKAADAVAQRAELLGQDLQKARDHSGIGSIFSDTVDRCDEVLAGVAAHANAAWLLRAPPPDEDQAERYTMQAERDIHQALRRGKDPAPDEPETTAGSEEEVEFF